jgi:pimeloyl-ACP methyl ester carboxylesterase
MIPPWKDLREMLRALSGILITKTMDFSSAETTQLSPDVFIQKIQDPPNPEGTVFVIRGGTYHMGKEGFYVRLSCAFLPRYRIFFFEKMRPMVNFDFADDVSMVLRYLRGKYSEPLAVMGFSMGGILTWSYLGRGYDDADLYVPISAPIDIDYFREEIHRHVLFRTMHKNTLKAFQVSDEEGLMKLAGCTPEIRDKTIQNWFPALSQTQDRWHEKTLSVSGDQDTLMEHYSTDLQKFNRPPHSLIVKGGSHCCMDVIWYACLVVKTYCQKRLPISEILDEIQA